MVIVVALLALLVGAVAGLAGGWVARGRLTSSLDGHVGPVAQALDRLDVQVRQMERQRAEAYGGLTEQVRAMRHTGESLRAETGRLVTALRTPQTRGRWGEMQLRRVIEAAGAVEHCHFSEQVTLDGDDGRHRPDVVVDLADGKQLAVDAKVPLLHWLAAMEAPDEAALAAARTAHARVLREHVKALADKGYWADLEHSPELVVLFVPADTFLDAALAEDPTLLEDAFARGVVPATPSTLVALLRTVAFGWRTERLSASTAEIGHLGRQIYERLGTMSDHLDRLGRSLTGAVGAYNATVGSVESRVLVTARRLADLDVSGADLPAPAAVTDGVRPLAAPELLPRWRDTG
ncbi:MAG TPA: DNA recombination protein RmuC [Mycobacteriales bacterium]